MFSRFRSLRLPLACIRSTGGVIRDYVCLLRLVAWSFAPRQAPRRELGVALTGPKAARRIGVLAGYGNTSYGDYYVGLGLAKALRELGFEPVILGRSGSLEAFRAHGFEAYCVGDRASNLAQFERIAREMDALLLGGGGLFEDRVDARQSQTLAAGYACRAIVASKLGLPLVVFGVGIEVEPYRYRTVEVLLRNALRRADRVCVRDRRSVEACRRFGIATTQVVDPAVNYLSSIRCDPDPDAALAGFIPFPRRVWPNPARPSRVQLASQDQDWLHVASALRGYSKVLICPFHRDDLLQLDAIARAFESVAPDTELVVVDFLPEMPGQVLAELRACSTVLTMRYHGFMASHFAGVRSIEVLGSSQKLTVTASAHADESLESWWNSTVALAHLQHALQASNIGSE
ncbi:polysaccharide pyruvyl transferase family protein [Gordonia hongkongensis]|uniref:polysaccharide pyruvyl transferase family protein n=1 Tax=Gordonia hongkongensis TaxID=1701090 RepID=UPI003BF7EAA5